MLSADRLSDQPFALSRNWKYHPGDNPAWADPAFDDSAWEDVDTRLFPNRLPESGWEGIGWFRLHLDVDPALWNIPLALNIYHAGASEVYLDGRLSHRFGTVGTSRADFDLHKLEAQNEALSAANRQVREATERKSAFLASMSHELRTPITSIKGYVDNLLDGIAGSLNARQRRNLERVTRNSDHLLSLVNDVLDLSKIEAGRMDVDAVPFDVKNLIDSCCDTVRPLVGPGVAFEQYVSKGIGGANTDEAKLRQIAINLLSNAAKFTRAGKIAVRCTKDTQPGENTFLTIAISDTGAGIPADRLDTIFDEFQQVGRSGERHRGTGLGLSITRRLTGLLGGTIGVESALGVGTTFTVKIPAVYRDRAERSVY